NNLKKHHKDLSKKDFHKARNHLYMAQANDSYWHGVFGGLYLNHLRSSVYSNLIEAEKIIDKAARGSDRNIEIADINLDGSKEVMLISPEHNLYFLPHRQAALFEWDYKPKSVNLTNTIMRRSEKYHQKLKEKVKQSASSSSGIPSIHEMPHADNEALALELFYDKYPRYSLIEHCFTKDAHLDDFIFSNAKEIAPPFYRNADYKILSGEKQGGVDFNYNVAGPGINLDIVKSLGIARNLKAQYHLRNLAQAHAALNFGVEFNFSLYDPKLSINKGIFRADTLSLNDVWYGIELDFGFEEEVLIWHFPVETISESELGIEKTYQGLCLVFIWELDIPPDGTRKFKINLGVK
ncbi:MAG: DUF1926 domain-containing protein, partial [Candidatus Omnitrophica bacterium]|nr:DUF1926 domain-containing protein [Candidatus Omnitrophota bacterium]